MVTDLPPWRESLACSVSAYHLFIGYTCPLQGLWGIRPLLGVSFFRLKLIHDGDIPRFAVSALRSDLMCFKDNRLVFAFGAAIESDSLLHSGTRSPFPQVNGSLVVRPTPPDYP